MAKIINIFPLDKTEGDFGVEIEVEGRGLAVIDNARWTTTDDGSLRGNYPDQRSEYVLKNPLPLKAAVAAVNELAGWHERSGSVHNFSFRTSCHVHVNVQEMEEEQVLNMLYTYYIIEKVLIRFCGESRVGNRFCLRAYDAEEILAMLADVFRNGIVRTNEYGVDNIRYAALNLAALRKYGSVEFRSMRGTMDTKVLTLWLTALASLREYGKKCASPADVYEDFAALGADGFLNKVLGITANAFKYEGFIQDINVGASLTIDLPFRYAARNAKLVEPEAIDQLNF